MAKKRTGRGSRPQRAAQRKPAEKGQRAPRKPKATASTAAKPAVKPAAKPAARGRLDPMDVVRELAALPHRGATTPQGARAADILERRLGGMGAAVERHRFLAPRTYIPILAWFLCGLIAGLLLSPPFRWAGLAVTAASAVAGVLFLDWRWTPLMAFPPLGRAVNLSARRGPAALGSDTRRLILMAHYDSAPTSLLYLPSRVKSFRSSLFLSLGVIVLAVVLSLLLALRVGPAWLAWLRIPLCVYFVAQGAMASIDFFRFGYTNGAGDNATGVGVAVATAGRLWRDPLPGWQVEVLLTSAEEASLVGAMAWVRTHRRELDPARTFVVNFDGLNAGDVRVVRRTGFITSTVYDNPLVDAALETARRDRRFASIATADWHTGDFDSAIFVRRGCTCLSLSAIGRDGTMARLHRPDDVLENVDPRVPALAVDFAEAAIRRFAGIA